MQPIESTMMAIRNEVINKKFDVQKLNLSPSESKVLSLALNFLTPNHSDRLAMKFVSQAKAQKVLDKLRSHYEEAHTTETTDSTNIFRSFMKGAGNLIGVTVSSKNLNEKIKVFQETHKEFSIENRLTSLEDNMKRVDIDKFCEEKFSILNRMGISTVDTEMDKVKEEIKNEMNPFKALLLEEFLIQLESLSLLKGNGFDIFKLKLKERYTNSKSRVVNCYNAEIEGLTMLKKNKNNSKLKELIDCRKSQLNKLFRDTKFELWRLNRYHNTSSPSPEENTDFYERYGMNLIGKNPHDTSAARSLIKVQKFELKLARMLQENFLKSVNTLY